VSRSRNRIGDALVVDVGDAERVISVGGSDRHPIVVTDNEVSQKKLPTATRATAAAVRDGHSGAEPAVGRPRQAADDVDDTRSDIGFELDEEFLLLRHEVGLDARAQVASRARRTERNGAAVVRIISPLDVPLLDQRLHDATRRALIETGAR
jgi:hypothetical protein